MFDVSGIKSQHYVTMLTGERYYDDFMLLPYHIGR